MYWPFSSVVVERVCWVLTLVAVTVTPGTAPPVLSLTLPRMVPVADCAATGAGWNQHECGAEGQEEREQPNGSVLLCANRPRQTWKRLHPLSPQSTIVNPDHLKRGGRASVRRCSAGAGARGSRLSDDNRQDYASAPYKSSDSAV